MEFSPVEESLIEIILSCTDPDQIRSIKQLSIPWIRNENKTKMLIIIEKKERILAGKLTF